MVMEDGWKDREAVGLLAQGTGACRAESKGRACKDVQVKLELRMISTWVDAACSQKQEPVAGDGEVKGGRRDEEVRGEAGWCKREMKLYPGECPPQTLCRRGGLETVGKQALQRQETLSILTAVATRRRLMKMKIVVDEGCGKEELRLRKAKRKGKLDAEMGLCKQLAAWQHSTVT